MTPKKHEPVENPWANCEPVHYCAEAFEQYEPDDSAPGWYFWDESQSFAHGPYETEPQAREALTRYAENL